MKYTGFLGLGAMGLGMSRNLIRKSPARVIGFDPVENLRNRFTDNGGIAADDLQTVCKKSKIIFMCLPTNEIVEKTVLKILDYGCEGMIIVDMGSTSPFLIRQLHDMAVKKNMHLLDAPVSGGKSGAEDGTLSIMCGGEREVFNDVKEYLHMMGTNVTYMGKSGCGSIAKVANNMIVGIHIAAIGEAFSFAKKAGLDPGVLYDAIKNGYAESKVMVEKVPKILKREFEPAARTAVHMKDIENAICLAESMNVDIPLTRIVMNGMHWMNKKGMIDEDHCALVKYYEDVVMKEIIE